MLIGCGASLRLLQNLWASVFSSVTEKCLSLVFHTVIVNRFKYWLIALSFPQTVSSLNIKTVSYSILFINNYWAGSLVLPHTRQYRVNEEMTTCIHVYSHLPSSPPSPISLFKFHSHSNLLQDYFHPVQDKGIIPLKYMIPILKEFTVYCIHLMNSCIIFSLCQLLFWVLYEYYFIKPHNNTLWGRYYYCPLSLSQGHTSTWQSKS